MIITLFFLNVVMVLLLHYYLLSFFINREHLKPRKLRTCYLFTSYWEHSVIIPLIVLFEVGNLVDWWLGVLGDVMEGHF